jgi:hypothetical protein
MKLGNYRLGQNVFEIENELTEVSAPEYRILGRSLKDERIYHGRDVELLGANWTVLIGVTGGRIYKVALQTEVISSLEASLKANIEHSGLWSNVFHALIDDYHAYTEQRREGRSFFTIWDREWGNIILTITLIETESVLENHEILDLSFTGNFPFKKARFSKKFL